ncbi:LysR family transcriptional regulator [Paludibacterium paludis]|uniref:LysR family transcriptional regulator n=1 Tax=Paludibacterium paludis TaxID=1225769 RepID=A0A918P4P6_9NEIS|nr:LysR substrate-binding domain-containing protein [Paludibacterium paludis]GGY22414.1 LysR family transcriptional regulator [Paludibacterium paludis]
MQLKWIKDLLALAQTRSFSRAAEARHITQSALSRRIQALEAWAGVALVDRSNHPLSITEAGMVLCEQGQTALTMLLDIRSAMQQLHGGGGSTIRVVAGHSLSLTCAPRLLSRFCQDHPAFKTRVVAANVNDSVAMLYDGQADLMVGYYHPQVPTLLDPDNFHSLRLYSESLIPLCAPAPDGAALHPIVRGSREPVPYLAYSPGTFFGRVASVILRQQNRQVNLENRYEGEMAMLLMSMAADRHGVAWLPESLASRHLAEGRLVRAADGWDAPMEVRAYCAAGNGSPALQALWQWLEGRSGATGAW